MVWPFSSRRGGDSAFNTRASRARVHARAAARASAHDEALYNLPEPFPRRVWRWFRRALVVSACLGLIAGTAAAGIYVRHFLYQTQYFKLRDIRVIGASPALEAEAREWLNSRLQKSGDNLVQLDRTFVMAGLSRLPRTKQVRVHKIYPDTLQLVFTERQPLALVSLGQTYLMDNEGVLLAAVSTREAAATDLPLVTGLTDFASGPGTRLTSPRLAEVLDAIQFINTSDGTLKSQIREWSVAGQGQVTALLRSGTEVRFGSEPLLSLLPKLSAGLDQKKSLQQAAYIDLRMDQQLVYKEGTAQQ